MDDVSYIKLTFTKVIIHEIITFTGECIYQLIKTKDILKSIKEGFDRNISLIIRIPVLFLNYYLIDSYN